MPKPYILQRQTGLYVRFLVPEYARGYIGSRSLVRSLGNLRGDAARLAAARLGYALAKHLDDVRERMSEQGKPPLKLVLRTGTGNEVQDYAVEILPDGTKRISGRLGGPCARHGCLERNSGNTASVLRE